MADARAMILNSILSGFQQPTAQLAQTQAATGEAGAMAGNASSETQARQQEIAQHQFITDTQKLFDSNKNKQGYVPPSLYNQVKEAGAKVNINGDSFDNAFQKAGYTDPKHVIDYNTSEGLQQQKDFNDLKTNIQNVVSQYQAVPSGQKGLFSKGQLSEIPILGQLVAPNAVNYEAQRAGLISNYRQLASEQQGSGIRVGPQLLSRLEALLPSVHNSDTVNNANIKSLDSDLKAAFHSNQGLDPQFVQNSAGSGYKVIQVH